ncbi:MAG TPA: hypothetical protein VF275_09420 [Gammaproteobacteria bacterium]
MIHFAEMRLDDAENAALSYASRFDLAYNAAHGLALAALRSCGYRSDSRYIVFQCLPHTLGYESDEWRLFDLAHRRRNLAEYEGDWDEDEGFLGQLIAATRRLLEATQAFSGKAD